MGKDRHSPGPDLSLEPVHRFLRSIAALDRNQSICGHCLASQRICDEPILPSAGASGLEAVLKSPEKASPGEHRFLREIVQMALNVRREYRCQAKTDGPSTTSARGQSISRAGRCG